MSEFFIMSGYLQEKISELDDFSGSSADDLAEKEADRKALLESVEQLHHNPKTTILDMPNRLRKARVALPGALAKHLRDTAAYFVDEALSRHMLAEVPGMVTRALKLEPVLDQQNRQADQNPYLREATRCYVFGLFNASAALSRSALEHGLSEKMPRSLEGVPKKDTLEALIQRARMSILKRAAPVCDLADKVRRGSNGIVHGRTCKESEALQILRDTREVLGHLYSRVR